MDKIQMIKMLLDACGNAGEGAAKLAILYFSMDMLKCMLTLALWAGALVALYKAFHHVIAVCNPPPLSEGLIREVRDTIHPCMVGTPVNEQERREVTIALTTAWIKSREKPK